MICLPFVPIIQSITSTWTWDLRIATRGLLAFLRASTHAIPNARPTPTPIARTDCEGICRLYPCCLSVSSCGTSTSHLPQVAGHAPCWPMSAELLHPASCSLYHRQLRSHGPSEALHRKSSSQHRSPQSAQSVPNAQSEAVAPMAPSSQLPRVPAPHSSLHTRSRRFASQTDGMGEHSGRVQGAAVRYGTNPVSSGGGDEARTRARARDRSRAAAAAVDAPALANGSSGGSRMPSPRSIFRELSSSPPIVRLTSSAGSAGGLYAARSGDVYGARPREALLDVARPSVALTPAGGGSTRNVGPMERGAPPTLPGEMLTRSRSRTGKSGAKGLYGARGFSRARSGPEYGSRGFTVGRVGTSHGRGSRAGTLPSSMSDAPDSPSGSNGGNGSSETEESEPDGDDGRAAGAC